MAEILCIVPVQKVGAVGVSIVMVTSEVGLAAVKLELQEFGK